MVCDSSGPVPLDAAISSGRPSSAVTLPLRTESFLPLPPRPTQIILDFSTPDKKAQKPLTRRGHVKSKLGCFTCKRRRVKCDEQHPVCAQCTRLKLACTYPPGARRQLEQQRLEAAAHTRLLQHSVGTSLSLEHLKFYHHFITKACPTVPLHERQGWEQCTAMSHEVSIVSATRWS